MRAELAAHLPGFESGEGKEVFAGEASVEVLELRGDYLQVAFVRLTPKGFKPCDDKAPQRETYALFVGRQEDGSERLRFTQDFAADETLIFDSKSMRVVVPPIAAAVPVFEVHYDRVPACLSDDEPSSGKMVEVFHLTSGARVGGPIPVDTSSDVPGHDSRVRSTIQWLRGRAPTTTLLAVTTTKTETTWPCTGDGVDDSSPECQPQVECERKTGIIALTREGEQTEHELATLRRSEPALARLPRDRTGSSQSACGRL